MFSAHSRLRAAGLVVGACTALALASCTSSASTGDPQGGSDGGGSGGDGGGSSSEAAPAPFRADLVNPDSGRAVPVDTRVAVRASSGTLEDVAVYHGKQTPKNMVRGELDGDKGTWRANDLLEPGVKYTVVSKGSDEAGASKTSRQTFRTESLTLDEQTYPSVAPLQGETVGVGMPVIVTFDLPVAKRAEIERHLNVESSKDVKGTWHWMSDTEVHYRPKTYWPSGTKVKVDVGINGVNAGNGIYGQEDRKVAFKVGSSVVSTVNVATHQMDVEINGEHARTIPITAGKPGFTTRSGVKVIMEKHEVKAMDAATVGISEGSSEYYNIPDVQYAMRVTHSGEFLHAAPWSVGSQGNTNVSHGCVGMSTENAAWLFGISKRGDVVKTVNSGRPLDFGNGWTDWDISWKDYKEGSALS
jgi:lipoprotein-anchoring transpeptidase ErfK/SrfK